MKKNKRIISVLLCFALLIMLQLTALASEGAQREYIDNVNTVLTVFTVLAVIGIIIVTILIYISNKRPPEDK